MTKGQQKAAGGPRATAGGAKGGLEAGLKTKGRQRQVAAPDQEVVRELGQRLDLLVCASLCSLACVDMVEVEGDGCSWARRLPAGRRGLAVVRSTGRAEGRSPPGQPARQHRHRPEPGRTQLLALEALER